MSANAKIVLRRMNCTGNNCGFSFSEGVNHKTRRQLAAMSQMFYNYNFYSYIPSNFLTYGDSTVKLALLADARLITPSTSCVSIGNTSVNSPVMIAGIVSAILNASQLPQPFNFSIQLSDKTRQQNPVCQYFDAFWNAWLTEGCKVIEDLSTATQIYCTCTKMASFSVATMSASYAPSYPSYYISTSVVIYFFTQMTGIFSAFLLGVLIFALILLITCGFLNLKRFLVLQQACSMLISTVVFIFGIDYKPSSSEQCFNIAVILHYFILAAFAWMVVEFWFYHRSLGKMDTQDHSQKGVYFITFALAYGCPLIPVSITMAIYSRNEYTRNDACWLSNKDGMTCYRHIHTHSYSFIGRQCKIGNQILQNTSISRRLVSYKISTGNGRETIQKITDFYIPTQLVSKMFIFTRIQTHYTNALMNYSNRYYLVAYRARNFLHCLYHIHSHQCA